MLIYVVFEFSDVPTVQVVQQLIMRSNIRSKHISWC